MSWQNLTYLRLRDRGWYQIGDLFEAIEAEIPLHLAMRNAMNPARGRTEMPASTAARWQKFLSVLSAIGVETSGDRLRFKWQDVVRLRYVEGRLCEDCGGPVIKAGWSGRSKTACLACETAKAPQVEEPLIQEVVIAPPPKPPGDQIGDAVAYAVLHRLISQWGPPMSHRTPAPWRQGNEARAPPVIFYWPVKEPIRRKPNERHNEINGIE